MRQNNGSSMWAHVRFDEGEVASAKPRRGSLLYKKCSHLVCAVMFIWAAGGAPSEPETREPSEGVRISLAVPDIQVGPRLRDVKLGSAPGEKLNAFIRERMTSAFAQKEIFGEARSAFERRDDDAAASIDGRRVGGLWRGEFWGKLMLGTARVADYLQDEDLLRFVREESLRMIRLSDKDGYLGSYGDKENVSCDGVWPYGRKMLISDV